MRQQLDSRAGLSDFWAGLFITVIAVSNVAILGILNTEGSSAFIVAIPGAYYILAVVHEQAALRRRVLPAAALVSILGAAVLMNSKFAADRSVVLVDKAVLATRHGDEASAAQLLSRATQWNPASPEMFRERISYASERSAGPGDSWDNRRRVGELYTQARNCARVGNHEQERDLYLKVLELEPRHPEAHYCLAMYYDTVARDRRKATEHLLAARDLLPPSNSWRIRCEQILQSLQSKP